MKGGAVEPERRHPPAVSASPHERPTREDLQLPWISRSGARYIRNIVSSTHTRSLRPAMGQSTRRERPRCRTTQADPSVGATSTCHTQVSQSDAVAELAAVERKALQHAPWSTVHGAHAIERGDADLDASRGQAANSSHASRNAFAVFAGSPMPMTFLSASRSRRASPAKSLSPRTSAPQATISFGRTPCPGFRVNRNGRITCAELCRHGIAPVPHSHSAYPSHFAF